MKEADAFSYDGSSLEEEDHALIEGAEGRHHRLPKQYKGLKNSNTGEKEAHSVYTAYLKNL